MTPSPLRMESSASRLAPAASASVTRGPILLFDGVCNVCNASVDLVLRRTRDVRVGALQSPEGQALLVGAGLDPSRLDSLVFFDSDGQVYQRSDAALALAAHFDGAWPLLRVLRAVPRPIRDAVYDLIARNRFRWFGQRDTCRLPTPEERGRFL